jgi:AcrR family transcriptional regulator
LRADAQANRITLLWAAYHAVLEDGPDVSPRDIAARAGVGVSTLYRHFRSRDALYEGIAVHGWAILADRIAARARHPTGLHAVRATLEELVGALAEGMPFIEATGQIAGRVPAALLPERVRAEREFGMLLESARARGEARRGVDHRDVFDLALGLPASARWRPQLQIVVDGLGATPKG